MKDKFVDILGFKVFSGSFNEALKEIDNYDKVNIISANPEVLYSGFNNELLYENFKSENSFIIPDGVGTIVASKLIKDPVKEKIAGVDFMQAIIGKCEEENKSIYLLGATEEVLQGCLSKIKEKYPRINISGYRNGFFREEDEKHIVQNIIQSKPYAIFIAMGCPKQEKFIIDYMDFIPCKIFMGVGGSFDVISGNVNRAPRWMIKLGLEWLYRIIKDPVRIRRLSSIPKFLWLVFKNR